MSAREQERHHRPVVAVVVAIVVIVAIACTLWIWQRPVATGLLPLPVGTSIGRRGPSGVDLLMWDGNDWSQVMPSGVISSMSIGPDTFEPEIVHLVVSPDASRVAVWSRFCSVTVEEADSCTARSYVYDVNQQLLTALAGDTAPIAWMGNSAELLTEDYMVAVGSIYDVDTATAEELTSPSADEGYMLPATVEGLAADASTLLFSGEEGPGMAVIPTGVVTRLAGISLTTSSWMSFDPTGALAAVVASRTGESNRVGAGVLNLYGRTGSLSVTVTANPDVMDFSPAWVEGGQKLAYLRAPADELRTDPGYFGTDQTELPAGLWIYDLATQQSVELLPATSIRRNVVAPSAAGTILFRQLQAGVYKTFGVPVNGGQPELLVEDGMEHTSVAAPRAD